jgi:hypothetical protein
MSAGGKHRTAPVAPQPHCFAADVDPALVEQVLGNTQRQREPDAGHHREAEHLGRGMEPSKKGEGILLTPADWLRARAIPLTASRKPIQFDV